MQAQLHIIVKSIPENTPEGDPIYLAGTVNGWNPGNEQYKLTKDSVGSYRITLNPSPGTIRFKFTRGSWQKVEGNATGGFIPDRVVSYNGQPKTEELTILGWEDLGQSGSGSTASPQVSILSNNFFIPQLNRNRKIWLYLPPDYNTTQKRYPVLYMHDGQNLFDRQTAFAGEWRVDESLDSLFHAGDHGCIVVGIENGGTQRLNEYSPWVNTQYGGGQGDAYIKFISTTLKPHIDSTYRTMPEPEFTGLMGSSMGGLITMYGGIAYPETFGKIGAFSSSFWFSQNSYNQVTDTGVGDHSYIYMIAGNQEGPNQVRDMEKMAETLTSAGCDASRLVSIAHSDGAHSEWYWAREFPKAYQWLFEKKTSRSSETKKNDALKVLLRYPELLITGESEHFPLKITFYDMQGMHRLSMQSTGHSLDISGLDTGLYVIVIRNRDIIIHSERIALIK